MTQADEMKQVIARLDGTDRQISDLSLVVFGNDTLRVVGLAERFVKIEAMLKDLVGWQRDIKLLLKIGVGLLTVLTGGTGVMAWPQIAAVLGKIAGG